MAAENRDRGGCALQRYGAHLRQRSLPAGENPGNHRRDPEQIPGRRNLFQYVRLPDPRLQRKLRGDLPV